MIPSSVRILVCTEPIDMRYGFDRLACTAKNHSGEDPQQGGTLFVFANRAATRLKLLWFDRNGYCLLYKRLHRCVFEMPVAGGGTMAIRIDAAALARLLGGVPRTTRNRRKCQVNDSGHIYNSSQ